MPRNLWSRVSLVAVVVLGSVWYLYPPQRTINLGLDLQGGIHLVLGVETDKHVASQTDRAAEDLKAALDRRGTATRRVARDGLASFVVELAASQSWNDALTVANEFQTFERSNEEPAVGRFRVTMQARAQRQVREDAAKQVLEKLRNRIDKFNVAEPTIARQGEDRILIQLPGIQDIQRAKDLIGKTGYLEFRLVERFLATVLDGVVSSAPRINERIPGGNAVITGRFTIQEAQDLKIVLNEGALPATVQILEERTVGPSLGADSIRQGMFAIVASAVVVVLFMLLYYRLSGLIAVVALILNLIILLACMAAFCATLTP